MQVNIETIDLSSASVDINNISEELFLGPQGDVLRKLEDINTRWDTNIGLNKKFGMKPGGYDQIKELLMRQAWKFEMKNAGIERLFSRIENYSYLYSHISREFQSLQDLINIAKCNNIVWSDNSEEGAQAFDFIKDKLNPDEGNVFDNIDFYEITLNKVSFINDTVDAEDYGKVTKEYKNYYIELKVNVEKEYMDICKSNGNIITQVPISPITLSIKINLLKLLNQYAVKKSRDNSHNLNTPNYIGHGQSGYHQRTPSSGLDETYNCLINIKSMYNERDTRLKHPFLSSRRSDGTFRGQCFGDLHSDILGDIWKLNLPMLSINLINLSSKFVINQTHPLNNWQLLFHGWPGTMNEEIAQITGKPNPRDCNKALDSNETGNVDYCNESKCQLRDDCRYYLISTTGIPTSPEKEALWGEIFEMCGYTDTHDQYFNTIIVDYTYKQLLEQHYNISILMKDKAFVEMCDELAECYSESRAYMYLNNMRWNDWDELRYQCENEGIDFYAIEEKYRANLDRVVTENDVMARIASMGGAVPINMPASPQEEVEVNRQVINDDIPF